MHTQSGKIRELTKEEISAFREGPRATGQRGKLRRADETAKLVELLEGEQEKLEPMSVPRRKGYMRNQPCPCGSGKKFKRCCWSKFA